MKNVTGLDLVKLPGGSWGTLGVPHRGHLQGAAARRARRDPACCAASTTRRAVEALSLALGSPFEVTGAAHLPAELDGEGARTLIRIEGFSVSIDYRLGELKRLAEALRRSARCSKASCRGAVASPFATCESARRAARPGGLARLDGADQGPAVMAQVSRVARRALVLRLGRRPRLDRDRGRRRRRRRRDPRGRRGRSAATRRWCARPTRSAPRVDVFEPLSEPLMRITAGLKAASIPPASSIRGGCMRGLIGGIRHRSLNRRRSVQASLDRTSEALSPKGLRLRRPCKPISPPTNSAIRRCSRRRRSSAPASIAASAPRPARPISCSATSSIQPARAHLPHQGHAGGRQAGDAAGRQAHRPLPVVPVLHDDLPLGRALHAPRRSRARLHRGDLPAALARPASCARCSPASCPIRTASASRCWRRCWRSRFKGCVGKLPCVGNRLRAMLELAPARAPSRSPFDRPGVFPAEGERRGARRDPARLRPAGARSRSINDAAIRLLNRHGVEVVSPKGEGCCGALVHHMGRDDEGARASPSATSTPGSPRWTGEGLDAIVITASGCGTTIKDYGFMFRDDPAYADKARARVARSPRTSPSTWRR